MNCNEDNYRSQKSFHTGKEVIFFHTMRAERRLLLTLPMSSSLLQVDLLSRLLQVKRYVCPSPVRNRSHRRGTIECRTLTHDTSCCYHYGGVRIRRSSSS
jgi:hypothetical protein